MAKKKQEREYVTIEDMDMMWDLKRLLDIKKKTCYYCKKRLKKGDKFSIFNKPVRLVCDSLLCLSEAVGEDEDD